MLVSYTKFFQANFQTKKFWKIIYPAKIIFKEESTVEK